MLGTPRRSRPRHDQPGLESPTVMKLMSSSIRPPPTLFQPATLQLPRALSHDRQGKPEAGYHRPASVKRDPQAQGSPSKASAEPATGRRRRSHGPSAFTVATPKPLPVERKGQYWWMEAEGRPLRLSNLEKVFWPKEGFTKGDVLAYYYNVAGVILPYLRGRPLTLKRMPEGVEGGHFYQKGAPEHTPGWMPRCLVEGEDGDADDYLMAEGLADLLFVANLGCIEFHPLHSRCDTYDRPDYLVFDLDPFPPATFDDVVVVARHVRVALDSLNITGYPKTSGATGMQIYVGVGPHHSYDETREAARAIGKLIRQADPERVTMEWEIERRTGKVFIDDNMNRRAASLASAYSLRPVPGAAVSTPLLWEEVERGLRPSAYAIESIHERLRRVGDLFAPVVSKPIDITPALGRLGIRIRPPKAPSVLRKRIDPSPDAQDAANDSRQRSQGEPGRDYADKRAFSRTPEPAPDIRGNVDPAVAPTGDSFVIHQHFATRLHFDLRLEMHHGDTPVLVSWAVPKNLPRSKGVRALAIHVEDHPFEYRTFSGTIPEGQYGAGEVRIFDGGRYAMLERSPGKLTFRLDGRRLRGTYHLVRTKEGDKEQWLAFLKEEPPQHRDIPPPPVPMLATLLPRPFDDRRWAFEPKWDGVRAIAVCDDQTRLVSRNGNDITSAYPELHKLHQRLVALEAMVDGEIVAIENGRPSFERLQRRMHLRHERDIERMMRAVPVTLIAFDLLYLDGSNLLRSPWERRRALLEEVLVPSESVQISPYVTSDGTALFEATRQRGLEGIVAKKLGSPYEGGRRSRNWLKVKTVREADFVVAGWSEGRGRRAGTIGSLVLGAFQDGVLRYVGSVGTGFDRALLSAVLSRLHELVAEQSPFPPATIREIRREHRDVLWVRPELVARAEFREITSAGRLRAPSFKGLRDDKLPEDCSFEELTTPAADGVAPSGP